MSLHVVRFSKCAWSHMGREVYLSSSPGDASGGYLQAADAFDVIRSLVVALESIENDDGRIPTGVWKLRNAALENYRSQL